MAEAAFERSVFINCPFDEAYEPILQAILFCVVYLGFSPRIARERNDSAEVRLEKITDLIEACKFSIHDLSRAQATTAGEYYRLNMPFEYGIDWACRRWFGSGRDAKRLLVLEEKPYRYQASISDISGSDIQYHQADYQIAVRKVRNWLVSEAGIAAPGAARILAHYADFQGWYDEKRHTDGFSAADIADYTTPELLQAMLDWVSLGQPIVFD
ncbi:hypothetical protein MKL09_14770 [Methylobacterium sp. J-048]|uniref:hypothetical protein n=1 Tax=Methylobacterium sp. J-048 TaxID=2836635 RepID=UPI001FB8930C|nr:hypothetical protein [Methylobacterium sp. J-048]MCJ2057814.1 hypothetical protein [Methylobacterium sp. J-048]